MTQADGTGAAESWSRCMNPESWLHLIVSDIHTEVAPSALSPWRGLGPSKTAPTTPGACLQRVFSGWVESPLVQAWMIGPASDT